jgi:murein DD-endopeptidase MepM/ murein hydrolase activator NlpD
MRSLWLLCILILLTILVGLGVWSLKDQGGCRRRPAPGRAREAAPRPPVSAFRQTVLPTEQEDLNPARSGVFQPTAAGNVRSALYGSVRTTSGNASSFHEGIDIAPVQRDAAGRPRDRVRVIADGTVAHVNRIPGNSNYGNYVVVTHTDPLGDVYTLYAHLAAIAPGLQKGQSVSAGTTLGLLGNTPTTIIPPGRAHLHFEVGLISNDRFDRWFRAQRLTPDHGIFNGMNLQALDPLVFFREVRQADGEFEFGLFLRKVPVAFELLVSLTVAPNYFRRYPRLWNGAALEGGAMVLSCSENGTVLAGRRATPDELQAAGGARYAVLTADEGVLGRNGCHLVTRQNGRWKLGPKGERWMEIWTY